MEKIAAMVAAREARAAAEGGLVGALAVSELRVENLSLDEKIERLQAAMHARQGTETATRQAGPTDMQ